VLNEGTRAGALSAEEAALWKRFVALRDGEARAQLIERYLVTAKTLAAALYANRFDDSVEFNDYLQYARTGLLEAIDRYDPTRGASFKTFAGHRIRGAILNGVEKSTEVASQIAERNRLRRERVKLLKETDRSSDAFLGMIDLTLNLAVGYLLEESGLWNAETEDRAADPYVSLEMKRLGERLTLLVEALPDREREIIRHHYYEHRDFVEISEMLGVSRGRISQLHTRALHLLRDGYRSLNQFDHRV